MTATLTSDGKATIPAEIREALAMEAGDRITFALLPGGTVVVRVKNKTCLYDENREPLPAEALR
jgi:antitoxin PrlF